MRFYASLFLCITGFYLLTASGRIGLSDSVAMFNVAQSVIDQRSLSSEPCEIDTTVLDAGYSVGCVPGVDGRHYAGFGPVPSLLVIPSILGARLISSIVHVSSSVISKTAASLFTILVAALACVVFAAWIVKLGYERKDAAAGAFVLAFASPFWHGSTSGFMSEPFFTLGLLSATCLLSAPRRRLACMFAGVALGMALGTRLNGLILLPAFVLFIFSYSWARKMTLKDFADDLLGFSLPLCSCLLLIAWTNYARFGSPFKTGYHLAFPSVSVLLSNPLLRGLVELFFNGEVGLFVFAPWLLLTLIYFPRFVREHAPEAILSGTSLLTYLAFHAKYYDWHAGWVAGTRLLIPVLPFAIVALLPAVQDLRRFIALRQGSWSFVRAFTASTIAVGFVIQLVGTLFPVERYYMLSEFYAHRPARPWWSGSIPLASFDFLTRMSLPTAHYKDLSQLEVRREGVLAYGAAAGATTEREFLAKFPNSANMTEPNVLWLKFRLLGIPAPIGAAYFLTSLALGLVGIVALLRTTRPVPDVTPLVRDGS